MEYWGWQDDALNADTTMAPQKKEVSGMVCHFRSPPSGATCGFTDVRVRPGATPRRIPFRHPFPVSGGAVARRARAYCYRVSVMA
ncbi:hypothetical protein GCM10026982_47060 [Nocardiopsis aegyptia]